MSLWEDMQERCVMQIYAEGEDGQGGQKDGFTDGDSFLASIVKEKSFEARVAEQQTGRATYHITTQTPLSFGAVFLCERDNRRFRVTSSGQLTPTPACASFAFVQATAEELT